MKTSFSELWMKFVVETNRNKKTKKIYTFFFLKMKKIYYHLKNETE